MGLERRHAIDNTQVIDFINATIATISWFAGKLVRIEYTVRVNFRICTSLNTAALRRSPALWSLLLLHRSSQLSSSPQTPLPFEDPAPYA